MDEGFTLSLNTTAAQGVKQLIEGEKAKPTEKKEA